MTRSVIIASGMRTAIGDFGGALSGLRPSELGVAVAAEAIARAGIPATEIQQVVFGKVIHTLPEDCLLYTSPSPRDS